MTLALILGFSALLLLLALALLWSRWPAWLKGLLVVGVTVFYFWGYGAVHEIWGLPSNDPLPERFVLLSARIDEPVGSQQGVIYLWVNPIVEGRVGFAPRAYRTKYVKTLHEQVERGMSRQKDGVEQMGTAEVVDGKGKGSGWLLPGSDEQEVKIRDLPVPQLPEK